MAKLSSSNGKKANVPKLRFPEFTEEWKASNIGEISTYFKGAPLSKSDISETGTPFILYGELYTTYKEVSTEIKRKTNCIVDKKYFSKIGDVVIPTSGETPEEIATATCVMTPNVILAGDFNTFRINDIDGRFFSYVINHKANKDISRIAQGKSIVHIKGEEISKIQIKYPSAEEQQKILSFIELLSLKIEKQEQLIDKLKKYKRGALSALFPKKGEITPQFRFAGFTKPWEQRKLGDLVDVCSGRDYKHLSEGDIPVYGTGGYMLSVSEALSYDKDAIGIGRKGTIDKPYILNAPFWTVDTLFYAIPREKIDLNFAFDIFQNIDWKKKDESTGVPSLSKTAINEIEVLVPQYDEQQALGQFFNGIDNLITIHQHKCYSLLSLKNALLQQMFI